MKSKLVKPLIKSQKYVSTLRMDLLFSAGDYLSIFFHYYSTQGIRNLCSLILGTKWTAMETEIH